MTDPASYRVIVTGDRHWRCDELAMRVVARLKARYGPGVTIVHGACGGVDQTFACAATLNGVTQEPHPADWGKHGKGAGPRRNAAMIAAGADLCLAVHRDLAASKGTKNCVRLAIAAGIPTWLISDDSGEPERLREGDARLQR